MDQLLLQGSEDVFDREVNRLIAAGDDRALLDLMAALPDTVKGLRSDAEERFDVPVPIVNACAVAAVALRRNKRGVVEAALDALLQTYRTGSVDSDGGPEDDVRLWETAVGSLWALGAVAVKAEDWATVRSIVMRAPEEGGHYRTWLRHGQVMSSRASTDRADDNVLNLCAVRLATNPSFGFVSESPETRDRFVAAFDLLAQVMVVGSPGGGIMDVYPSYAKFPVAYVEPHVIALRRESEVRTQIFPGSDSDLRAALRDCNEMALYQAAQDRYRGGTWAYEGFQDARTWAYLREGHFFEEWPAGVRRL